MSEEFNNNEQNEYSGNNNNQEPVNASVQQPEQPQGNIEPEASTQSSVNQGAGQGYSMGGNDAQSFSNGTNTNQMNYGQYYTNPYPVYPTPKVKKEKKPKDKKRRFGIFKLTAAALIFGIISGAVFQGYYIVTNNFGNNVGTDGNNAKVTEVAQEADSKDAVVPVTTGSGETVTDVSDVVDKVMPSIVAINATVTTTASDFFGRAYSQEEQSSGSGIIIDQNNSNLLIVTNNHVINGATSVEITFSDGKKASAVIKGADANADLAVLSVKMSELSQDTIKTIKVATLGDSTKVKAGEMAIAIGNALGYGQSVTVGYISAVDREVDIENNKMKLLQTDAAINPGNSGGALLNAEGQVIGINSVKYASTEVEGMGYAIPISSAIPMINQLMNRETVASNEQGYLGLAEDQVQDVTSDISDTYNMPVGIYVNDVIKDSPAAKAGLEAGNIITGIDDFSVKTVSDLKDVLTYKKAGDVINLKIQVKQNGAYVEKTLKVTLGHK